MTGISSINSGNVPFEPSKSAETDLEARLHPLVSEPRGKLFQSTGVVDSARSIQTGMQIANGGEAVPIDMRLSAEDMKKGLSLIQNVIPNALTGGMDTASTAIDLVADIGLLNQRRE